MSSLVARLKSLVSMEPAVLAWGVNGGLATVLAFVAHLSPTQTAAVTTIVTALAAVLTAVKARPVAVSAITGGLVTIVTACAAFGLHLPPTELASGVAALSAVLGLVFRANLTPAVKVASQK